MERKECIIFLVHFVTALCVYNTIDLVAASKVLTEKTSNEKPQSEVQFTKTKMRMNVHETFSHMRRSIQEQGDIGPVDVCANILGRNWNRTKKGKSPCPTLVVRVPKKLGFTEFVKVNEDSEVEGGFSIAIFCHALRLLPYNVQPIFKPFINDKGETNGTYDELLRQIEGQACEAVAGDVSIQGSRAQYVSFTIPYLSADVYMLMRGTHEWNQNLSTFLKPFTKRLWITLVFTCFLAGFALAFLEFREHNPEFASPFYRQLVMVIWFPISTFFLHEGKIRNKCSKVVLVMWLCMLFIVLQIFTATLSSWLTLDQLRPPIYIKGKIGYQDGSTFLKDFMTQKFNISNEEFMPLKTVEEYKNALSNGSVGLILDELPYIDLFLSLYGSEYMKFGPLKRESGIAFAFPLESPMLQIFSKAVVNVTESDTMMVTMKEYLGLFDNYPSQINQGLPRSLDVQSFIGLFVFMGIVIIAAIISSEVAIMQRKSKTNEEKKQKEEDKILVENFLIFMTVAAIIASDSSSRRNRIRVEEG